MGRLVIGISGRKESGKSVLSSIGRQYGFEVVRFAEPLKRLIAQLIYVSRDELDNLKTVERNYTFHERDFQFIADETLIPLKCVKDVMEGKTFKTVRDLLQIIGTDLIREQQPNWHVKRTLAYLQSDEMKDKNVIIDDLRFSNERAMIHKLGGTTWYIIRPKVDNISNHISETSLVWQSFDNVIINNESLQYLEHNWRVFLENGYEKCLKIKQDLYAKLLGCEECKKELIESKEKFTILDALFISKYDFTYDPKFLYREDEIELISAFNNSIMIQYTENDKEVREVIDNPLMIEDLKRYMKIKN